MIAPLQAAAFADVVRQVDAAASLRMFVLAPAVELQHAGWRTLTFPPILSAGIVGVTLDSVGLAFLFLLIMVPLAVFFYWVISNLRRVRRTLHDINNTLQVMVGRDPAAMKRIQEAHRERLSRSRPR